MSGWALKAERPRDVEHERGVARVVQRKCCTKGHLNVGHEATSRRFDGRAAVDDVGGFFGWAHSLWQRCQTDDLSDDCFANRFVEKALAEDVQLG